MKPTQTVPPAILDNARDFTGPFYARFPQRKAPQPLDLTDKIQKDYMFPTLYGDVTCAQAIFLCSYAKAAALVAENLHPLVTPVRMPKGRAVVAFSSYEYKKVMGVPPYNEIAVAVPVMVNAGLNPPVLPLVLPWFSRFGYYIASMPVTSLENTIRGNKIWGLPKVTQEIDIAQEGSDCVTKAYETDGSEYFRLTVPTTGKPTRFNVQSHLISRLNGIIHRSQTNFQADFAVNKYMNVMFKPGLKPVKEWIRIGSTPSAAVLNSLDIEEHPFQFRYAEHMSACFDLPDLNPPSWLKPLNSGRQGA